MRVARLLALFVVFGAVGALHACGGGDGGKKDMTDLPKHDGGALDFSGAPDIGAGCGDVTGNGECNGTVLKYCTESMTVETHDCNDDGLECGVDSTGYADCVEANADLMTLACGNIDDNGICEGDVVKYCEHDALRTIDCAAGGKHCTVDSSTHVADCT